MAAAQRPTEWNVPTKTRLDLPSMQPSSGASGSAGGTSSGGQGQAQRRFIAQSPPPVWESQPADPGRFRDLAWRIAGDPSTECWLTAQAFGGVQTNLTRWYGQFGVKEVAALESLPVVELAGKAGRLLELAGTYQGKAGQAMMLAFTVDGDTLTTLKFVGPEAAVRTHRDAFLALAGSLRGATVSPDPTAPPIQPGQPMPDNHPPVPDAGQPHQPAPAAAPFTGTAGPGWTPKTGTSRALHHTFGDDGEVYVSQLGGALRGSLDIWRSEMGLPAIADAEFAALPKVPMLGAEGVLLDVAGNHHSMTGKQIADARMLVAALANGGSITFAKLVGKATEVEAQRAPFLAFCASLRRSQ